MEWKHKKESKWLIVENRKVHCYLCGRKMLKASQRIYDAESGHYSHAICEKEKQLTGTNERRSAVKKIVAGAGVLGLTAVGVDKFTNFGRMSNSVFSSNAKDQTANPELETVITSQGIILPSLKSDPANPVAGQMWYRSDAGVTAHFDSIQNRVVYSSEINNGNVNVTSKGIVNGLSVLPNDGTGGFGPDTTSGATSIGQIGSPYTQTVGTQEAIDYAIVNNVKVKMKSGTYKFTGPNPSPSLGKNYVFVTIPSTGVYSIDIEGEFSNLSNGNSGVIWDMTDLPSPSTNNSWYAFGWDGTISNMYGAITLKNITMNTPQNVGFVDGVGCAASVYENINGFAASVATFDNCGGFAIDGYTSNVSWANNLFANNVYNAFSVSHSHLTAGTLNANLCQTVLLHANVSLGSVILKLNAGNCGTMIESFDTGASFTGKVHIFQLNEFTSPFNSAIAPSTDFVDTANLLSVEIDVYNHVNQETSGANYNWLTPTYDGGQFIQVHNIMGTTGKLYLTPTLSANPPVSGTVYQNTNPYDIEIDLPVYATTSGTAGYVTIAKGSTDTPTAIGNQYVSGDTSSTATQIIRVRVPAGWYYSFTGSAVTFATATPFEL